MKNLIITLGIIIIISLIMSFQYDCLKLECLKRRLEWAADDMAIIYPSNRKEYEEVLKRYTSKNISFNIEEKDNQLKIEFDYGFDLIGGNPAGKYIKIYDKRTYHLSE